MPKAANDTTPPPKDKGKSATPPRFHLRRNQAVSNGMLSAILGARLIILLAHYHGLSAINAASAN